MNTRVKEVKRVWWKGMLGTVLATGKNDYYVAFKQACQFVPKDQCELVYGYWKHETQEA